MAFTKTWLLTDRDYETLRDAIHPYYIELIQHSLVKDCGSYDAAKELAAECINWLRDHATSHVYAAHMGTEILVRFRDENDMIKFKLAFG